MSTADPVNVIVSADGSVTLPARRIPPPTGLSEPALAALAVPRPEMNHPAADDKAAWRDHCAQAQDTAAALYGSFLNMFEGARSSRYVGDREVHVLTPHDAVTDGSCRVVLELHGGGMVYGGGPLVPVSAAWSAMRLKRTVHAVDYRMPPDHPYPAALDDAVALYRDLLTSHAAGEIVVSGPSAGGNLAAALVLRARDEGLPLPAGLILLTPEVDLTESGDSFETLMGLDIRLTSRMTNSIALYADGADLRHPYLSPLFGDFTGGFPPTFLQAGTRDLLLSNAARMHRALRRAGVRAELHIWDGMPHGGFSGMSPEDWDVADEIRRFLAAL